MMLRRPERHELREIARGLGMNLGDADIEFFLPIIDASLRAYDRVAAFPVPRDVIRYPRTPGTHPAPGGADNPHGAWYVRTEVKGAATGPLTGRTVALKDNICLAGVPMTVGARVLEGYTPDVDATVVTRLLDAGATVLGKTMCEYMCFSGSSQTSQPHWVRNPRNPAYSAGGSSSGSAAAVAGGEVDLALGGDQGGSVRIPAAYCGVYGMKPTFGLVPYTGAVPLEMTIDHLGPITASVADNALLLQVIAGADGLDPRQGTPPIADYSARLGVSLHGVTIGLLDEGFALAHMQPSVAERVRAAAAVFRELGADVRSVSVPMHDIGNDIWVPIGTEGGAEMLFKGMGLGVNNAGVHVDGLLEYQARWRNYADELSDAVKSLLLTSEFMARSTNHRYYGKAQNLRRLLRAAYDEALRSCDVLLMPTVPNTATRLPDADTGRQEQFDQLLGMVGNVMQFNATGHPALAAPCAMSDGLPVSMMLVGRPFEEATLYQVAHAFEQAVDWVGC